MSSSSNSPAITNVGKDQVSTSWSSKLDGVDLSKEVTSINYWGFLQPQPSATYDIYNRWATSWDVHTSSKLNTFWDQIGKDYLENQSKLNLPAVNIDPLTAVKNTLIYGTGFDPDQITAMSTNYILSKISSDGVFSSFMPGARNGFLIADWYSTLDYRSVHMFTDPWFNEKDTSLGSWPDYVTPAVNAYETLIKPQSDKSLIINSPIFIGGSISNSDIKMQSTGDQIFIVSPTENILIMGQADQTDALTGKNWNRYYSTTYYPTAHGEFASNNLQMGSGSDLVYYDSSFKFIRGGAGNDTFAPSYGSFNFATDYMLRVLTEDTANMPNNYGYVPFHYPTPTPMAGSSPTEFMFAPQNGTTSSVVVQANTTGSEQAAYIGSNYEVQAAQTYPDANNKNNVIGGEIILGGPGDDTFYGADPSFYTNNNPGGETHVYLTQNSNTSNARFMYQNYHTIKMFGGDGADSFYLGNPTIINTDAGMFDGVYSYQIAVNHDDLQSTADRSQIGFADTDTGTNIVSVNLTGNSQTYINSSSNYTANEEATNKLDNVKAGLELVGKIFDKRDDSGATYASKLWDKLPYVGTAISVVSMGITAYESIPKLVKFLHPDAPPVENETVDTVQVLAEWKKSVAINDWDPNTVLQIKVNPTIKPDGTKVSAFNTVGFDLITTLHSADSEGGTTINWKTGSSSPQPLIELTGFASNENYGYKGYSFISGNVSDITAKNLSFFGVINNADSNIKPLTDYTAGLNAFPFHETSTGGSMFYWNDVNTSIYSDFDLMKARASASEVVLQFDSRTLGWYWDFQASDASVEAASQANSSQEAFNSIVPDETKSKLWYLKLDKDGKQIWDNYSISELHTNVEAAIIGLKSRLFYQTHDSAGDHISAPQKSVNDLIDSYDILSKYIKNISEFAYASEVSDHITDLSQITSVQSSGSNLIIHAKINKLVAEFTFDAQKSLIVHEKTLEAQQVMAYETSYAVDLDNSGTIGSSVLSALAEKSDSEFINELYTDILDRTPDDAGSRYWLTQLQENPDRINVIKNFFLSTEFSRQYTSDQEFVNVLYHDLLNRDPDPAGLNFWLDQLDQGQSESEVLNYFLTSLEFKTDLIGLHLALT